MTGRTSSGGQRPRTGAIRLLAVVIAAGCAVGFGTSARVDTAIDFEQFPAGTVLTNQYADSGGTGQGVVFGPLPAGAPGPGLYPVVRVPPAGQAQSGSRVADIATCSGCEFFTPRTTGTFSVPRSRISLRAGYLGDAARCTAGDPNSVACALITLRAFDRNGAQVAQASVLVQRGAGIHSPLSVSTASATIVGFEITGRESMDVSKPLAIDDLTLGTPTPAPTPDFTLNPAATTVAFEQGGGSTDAITIGRLNGSTGGISLRADGLPAGVTATFSPNPATGSQSVLTLAAAPDAPLVSRMVTITGTPQSASAGPTPRSFTLSLGITAACPKVLTAGQLFERLVAHFKCVFVAGEIDLADVAVPADLAAEDTVLRIPDGVTLMGGRSPTQIGGMLSLSHRVERRNTLSLGSNTRVTGLRIHGYQPHDRADRKDGTRGISVFGSTGVTIDSNDLSGWPDAAVYVDGTPDDRAAAPRITGNFIHNNVQCNHGYGVVFSGTGFAHIDRNVFNYNRHDVAGHGDPGEGYVADHNLSLTSGPKCDPGDTLQHYNQHYDMHGLSGGTGGTAGTFMEIRNNTIRGAQTYYVIKKRPAFWLRGTPEDKAIFAGNAVHSSGKLGGSGAARVTGVSGTQPSPELNLIAKGKLVVADNRLCVDTAAELAVGDFDGDGRADVFQAVGTVWVYSPSAQREWHVLNTSTFRLRRIGLGDFNGDGKTDVFVSDHGRWYVSDGGTELLRGLPAGSSIDVKNYRFGDFDGDRKTDVFRASGSRFFISSGGATAWEPLAASKLSIGDLRFGDFDGDGTTDVFSLVNNQWSVSYAGSTSWQRLNAKLSSKLGKLVFADFTGDRKTDVARNNNGRWEVSDGGAAPWRVLQFGRSEPLVEGILFGDFNGDRHADVLQHGVRAGTANLACWAIKSGTTLFKSFERFRLSSGGSRPFQNWSSADMR